MKERDKVDRLAIASKIAKEAGEYAKKRFLDRASLGLSFKGPQDFLTEVDGQVEALIFRQLKEIFPKDSLIGEESGGNIDTNSWFIDPIDGTANFARGLPQFCISIAYLKEKKIELGIIYDPMRDELFSAARGKGAHLNGKKIQVSNNLDISQSVIELGWSPRRPRKNYLDLVDRTLSQGASFRRGGSGALALAYVADGRQDGYCELHMYPWDALAGLLLVQEAGGWINDYAKSDTLMQGAMVIAATPGIKSFLLKAING